MTLQTSPFFSVVIPSFNRADLLMKAIKSIMDQTFDNWELIVIDDGSTDNTATVVRTIEDERVCYVYQANAERSTARNNGVAHAKGQYICFLDSDDYYLPERLALLHHELVKRNCPVEMFYTAFVVDKSDKITWPAVKYNTTGSVFDNIAINVIHSQQVCISHEILKEFKYDSQFRIGEDMELWLRIAERYPVTYIEEQYTVAVSDHDDRSVNVMRYNSGKEQLTIYKHIFAGEHPGRYISERYKLFMLAGAFHAIAKYNVYQGNRLAAAVAMFKAINVDRSSAWLKFRVNILMQLITFSPMEKIRKLIEY